MMRHTLPMLLVIFALLGSGCLTKPESFGCCLRANATVPDADGNVGCVLYNTTSYLSTNEYYDDSLNECDPVTGCEVPIGSYNVEECDAKGKNCVMTNVRSIPICSDDQLATCVQPNCTAMVCGDFAFKPAFAPGFTGTEDAGGDVPADMGDEGGTMKFYKAQCRFLPMDAKLKQIMKNSKSQINVFRMGVGGSFDEFDQYRYFLPISDKYCSMAASGLVDDVRVDRYMNYLTASYGEFNPVDDITENCIDDTSNPPGADSPFGFTDYSGSLYYIMEGMTGSYNPILPDKSNYRFAYKARLDGGAYWGDDPDGYRYSDYYIDPQYGIYKKMDSAFYRKMLSIVHLNHIYGLAGTGGGGRAAFECDISSNDCYSNVCSTDTYSRGTLLEEVSEGEYTEVITDCNEVTDPIGFKAVVCSPLKSILKSGTNLPLRYDAQLSVKSFHMTLDSYHRSPYSDYEEVMEADEDDDDGNSKNELFKTWDDIKDIYKDSSKATSLVYSDWVNTPSLVQYEWTDDCDICDDNTWCEYIPQSTIGPPAGGIVFFGKIGDSYMKYDGKEIIGYSLADEDQFKNTLLYQNCELSTGSYIVVDLSTKKANYRTKHACNSSSDDEDLKCTCERVCKDHGDCDGEDADCESRCSNPKCMDGLWEDEGTEGEFCRYTKEIEITPENSEWSSLKSAFRNYFKHYVNDGLAASGFGDDGCGKSVEALDVVFSAMPWVISFEKGVEFDKDLYPVSMQLTSVSAQAIRDHNTYDEDMSEVPGTTSCELRRAKGYMSESFLGFPGAKEYYNVLMSSTLILIKNPSNDGKLGKCVVDIEGNGLPKVRTFGWCEPCTTSTLAYQKLTAKDSVYMPIETADITYGYARNNESLCQVARDYHWDWSDIGWYYDDNVSCFNAHITDLKEYRESIGDIGSPRTQPEATIVKERLGEYMKAGVLPVLDISDDSNWNMDNLENGEFEQYDFQRLFGNMGAVIVIVDNIASEADGPKQDRVYNRTATVRTFCQRCLTAVHVSNADSNETFKRIINSLTGDGRINANLDMMTFNYRVTERGDVYAGETGLQNKSYAIARDIASYGRASIMLAAKGKPVMVVGLNVQDNDPVWNDQESYDALFQGIVLNEADLVDSGVIGIIYRPASTNPADAQDWGLVDRESSTVGLKTSKFCAFQNAMRMATSSAPVAIFTETLAIDRAATCVPCSNMEIALDQCGPSASPNARICDDGSWCNLPTDLAENEAKCPDDVVTPACKICSDIPGNYQCTRRYANGSTEPFGGPMSEVTSDIYIDVLAGLPAPYKCCLAAEVGGSGEESDGGDEGVEAVSIDLEQDDGGSAQLAGSGNGIDGGVEPIPVELVTEGDIMLYTYVKKTHEGPVTRPIVFSKAGDPNVDCGMGNSADELGKVSEFCGVKQIPLREYDVTCEITGG